MNHIKDIFLGKSVDYIHNQYTRYGKGTFDGPALAIKNGKSIKADGSVHYANILGGIIAESAQGDVNASGSIFAKREIKIPVDTSGKKTKGDLHSLDVTGTLAADALKMIYTDYPDANILLELSTGAFKLKCKKKPPKPGGGLDEKFCSAILEKEALGKVMDEVLFDAKDKNFKEAEIKHRITIEELVGSPELKKDPARFRREAKRKGRIKRTVTIDGKTTETIKEFII
ncbi:MAG: hypothetical protein PHG85_03475 [Candidatus Altiarchaeota archaeon]|nr:hypothetical protein [Candidatus Altiarchaeota archaeon]